MYIIRQIETEVKANLYKGKIIIIYGARQVGKTTLVRKILSDLSDIESLYLNCDEADIQKLLRDSTTSTALQQIIGASQLVVIDEAQRIKDVGMKLKLLVDNFPNQQVIVTGSSSFELANEAIEPLTGRNIQFTLYPLSLPELAGIWNNLEINRHLETLLIYGSYPAVIEKSSLAEKMSIIKQISQDYLYKDILKFQNFKNSEIVEKLLVALALQVGKEVSYTELASLIGVSKQTVASYIDLLEKTFVIFKLKPFSRNLRKELGKLHKIYFWDLGVRNAIINNFNPIALRNDVGELWESFIIGEKRKQEYSVARKTNTYFWRTYDQQEIDLIEEKEGRLFAYEAKWKKARFAPPKSWRETYHNSTWISVTPQNYLQVFIG